MSNDKKTCQNCAALIDVSAFKCQYCNEVLVNQTAEDDSSDDAVTIKEIKIQLVEQPEATPGSIALGLVILLGIVLAIINGLIQ